MAPKLYHKKSKTGCSRCRARRVKCDEARPTCGHCRRHHVECRYEPQSQPKSGAHSLSVAPEATQLSPDQEPHIPESRSRRLLELRLFYHYTETTWKTLDTSERQSPQALAIWKDAVIRLAFVGDAMLYSVLAISAQHLAQNDPRDPEAREAALQYVSLALPLHRRDVAELNKASADLVCLTGSLLRCSAFAMLHQRPLEPYTPPAQFLLQARGSLEVFRAIWCHVSDDLNSIARLMVSRTPFARAMARTSLFSEENRQPLLHLLHRSPEHRAGEPWSGDIESAYEGTLSVLGKVLASSKSRAPLDTALKRAGNFDCPVDAEGADTDEATPTDPPFLRLVLFPMLVPDLFIQLVVEAQPRALVVLAHYFAALAEYEHIWWISTAGVREIRGILTTFKRRSWESGIVSNLLQTVEGNAEGEP